jgi:ketosteroid isomerase-like protein
MSLEQNKALALAFLRACAQADTKQMGALMSETATWWVLPSTPMSGLHTKAEFLKLMPAVTAIAETRLSLEFNEVTAEDNRVCVAATGTMKLKNGKTYNNVYHFLIKISGEKIIEGREYFDTAGLNEAFS